jgi:plasmid stability protein
MAQLVVRNINEDVKARLKKRAEAHGHSMEEEVRMILTEAALARREEKFDLGDRIAARFKDIDGPPLEIEELRGEIHPAEFE